MPSLASIRHEASQIAQTSYDATIQRLATIVELLAAESSSIQRKADEAKDLAEKALKDSKRH